MEISILMPVRNTAAYLAECLHSIIAQEERNWELIAVDDHSTDDSYELLCRFAMSEPRIRPFRNPGRGIAPALQLAFQQSRCPLVTRMDSDDVMLPTRLSALKELLLKHGTGHVATGAVACFTEGKEPGEGYVKYAAWLNDLAANGGHFDQLYRECVIPSPCWMARRDDLAQIGAFTTDVYPEDYDLCFRMYHGGLKVVSTPEILLRWRDHPKRSSRTLEQYRDNSYLPLKIHWFLKTDHQPARPLVLWGAGRKGKTLAKLLLQHNEPFTWVCNQPSKWGHRLHGIPFEPVQRIRQLQQPRIIVAVAGPADQKQVRAFLRKMEMLPGEDYFFFA